MGSLFIFMFFCWIIYLFINHEKNKVYVKTDIQKEKCESPIEHRLYSVLKSNGYHPTTQVKVGRYRIDLAFENQKLAIECDGKPYHSSPNAKARDKRKDAYLRSQGWKILRFSGTRILLDIKGILQRIENELRKSQS